MNTGGDVLPVFFACLDVFPECAVCLLIRRYSTMANIWPVCVIVSANVLYQVCAKLQPGGTNPFATLIISYGMAMLIAALLFFFTKDDPTLGNGLTGVNWVPFVFGMFIVMLEFGCIMLYRVGWDVSVGMLICSIFAAVGLTTVGIVFFHEAFTWYKVAGVACFIAGSIFINMK